MRCSGEKFLKCWMLLGMCLATTQLWGQAVGVITGTVTDATGAVIPHAKVTATREETKIAQSTLTSDSGTFVIPNLPVGTYTVQSEASGFAANSISGITLDVSQTRNLDFKLAPAGSVQVMEVNAAPPLINTTDGSLAGLVSQHQVESLPLNGRSIQNLVMLQPGMAQDTGSMGWLAPQWISNGNRGETEVATLDGADATDTEMGTIQFWNFNLDAIAEFKVQQANYSAEFGQGGGTITQIVSKSGTNQFHGSVFEFLRNNVFDAANYASPTVPILQRNEFGVTFGGPIFRNKTFFFGEYAGFRQRYGVATTMNVPTAAERTGQVAINGYTYQVPLNSVSQDVMSKYPNPNQPDGIYGANTYNTLFKQPTDNDQYSVRIDHKFSDRDSIFGRASVINNSQKETDAVAAIEDPSFSSSLINNPRNFAISETHIVSPKLINNFLFAVNRQIEGVTPPSQEYTQTTTSDSYSAWGPDTFITKYVETYYITADKVEWNWGRNFLTIGMDYRYGQDNGLGVTGAGPNGQYTFQPGTPLTVDIPSTDGGPTLAAGSASPNGKVSLMAGDPARYQRSTTIPGFGPAGGGSVHWGLRVWHIAPFIQDDIKLTPKLTLNLGLRYEYNSVPYEIESRLGGVVDSGPLYGHFVLNPQPLYNPDYTSFAPRFGIAYHATPTTVLRGGLAIFSNTIPMVYPDQAAVNFPIASYSALTNPEYSMTPLPVSLPTLLSTSGVAMPPNGNTKNIPANTPVDLAPIAAQTGNIIGDWPSDKLKNGYTLTGNFTLEQQLPGDMAMQLSYVTNNGINLYQSSYPNAYTGAQTENTPFTNVTPGLGEIQIFYNDATSHYNALQAQVRKITPVHGLQYQVNYTWGKNMTNADAVWSAPGASGGVSLNDPTCIKCEYAPASYSLKQRLVANFSYQVPGKWGVIPDRISKGWEFLGIYSVQSGLPFTINGPYGTLQYGFDSLNGVGARPFFIKRASVDAQHVEGGMRYLSEDVIDNQGNYFSVPTVTSNIEGVGTVQTSPGNLFRNTYVGPGQWNFDFSMVKDTRIAESVNMQFRAEFFNILNHPTFGTPGGTLSSSNFGISSANSSTERQMQFALRFTF